MHIYIYPLQTRLLPGTMALEIYQLEMGIFAVPTGPYDFAVFSPFDVIIKIVSCFIEFIDV